MLMKASPTASRAITPVRRTAKGYPRRQPAYDPAVPRLRLHADRSALPAGSVHPLILFPFWGMARGGEQWPDYADAFLARGSELFELVEPVEAELVVFPENWKQAVRTDGVERARAILERAAGKPVAIFFEGDDAEPLPVEGAWVFRTSLHASRRRPQEFALPGFHGDLLQGELPLRCRRSRATVGFCGVALVEEEPAGAASQVRRALGERRRGAAERRGEPLPQDVFVRSRAIEALVGQRDVDTNLVIRGEGGGGAMYPTVDHALWAEVRAEYVANLVSSDYALCARGVGNWSWRLYEALSLGRIPVFVDTDCVLPYDFLVDWRELCVWVDRSEVGRIGEQVAAFHESLTDGEFLERQRRCRQVWEDYLCPLGFFANFHRHLER
jgi:hypothetical protein